MSLKTVSSSRTTLIQGWVKHYHFSRDFTNCPKLDNNARSNIMEEAHIRIMREATSAPSKDTPWPQINVVCPGKEISNWFSYQSEGSSVNIKLRPDWFQTGLFGFALSAVVSGVSKQHCSLTANANFIGKFKGESHKLFTSEIYIKSSCWNYCYDQHHVYVWNEAFRSEEEEEECSPDSEEEEECSPDVEASVDFCLEDEDDQPISDMKVESCGICLFYAEDAKKFKFDHVFMLREPKVEEETRQDDDSKGGQFPQIEEETREDDNSKGRQSRDEPEASGSSDESEANESDEHGSEASGTYYDSDF
ncbi:hypothetical protein C1H46_000436 [Malus baccata]|uniref:C-JID domain-containing protein n=1 Tax=Malus baccata TaxID=106549 RepID=A0A540NS18_MALBA|nr:hypothetical protein C1H46_000436 [Malus baccata]